MRERFVASHELRDSRKVGRRFDSEAWHQRQTVEFLERGNAVGFFSDFLPSAMALQREQGCLPSKVRTTASGTERD